MASGPTCGIVAGVWRPPSRARPASVASRKPSAGAWPRVETYCTFEDILGAMPASSSASCAKGEISKGFAPRNGAEARLLGRGRVVTVSRGPSEDSSWPGTDGGVRKGPILIPTLGYCAKLGYGHDDQIGDSRPGHLCGSLPRVERSRSALAC